MNNTLKIRFFYKLDWIKSINVTAKFDNTPLTQVLNQCFIGKDLTFKFFQENSVFIFPKNADKQNEFGKEASKVLVVGDPLNQGRYKKAKLSGRVFEGKTGEPLSGAVVYNPETKIGVATDSRGRYSLELPTGEVHIQITFMSFENQLFNINLIQDGKADFDLFEKTFAIAELTVYSSCFGS